ncbi:MAG: chorismate mutase [Bacillota bacterium]
MVRAVRGATTVTENSEKEILDATGELLGKLLEANGIKEDDIISIIFSVTSDLNAAFPAVAARRMGLNRAALLCVNEIDVPGSLKKCIRILIHFNSDREMRDLRFVYLKNAQQLRPDIFDKNTYVEE